MPNNTTNIIRFSHADYRHLDAVKDALSGTGWLGETVVKPLDFNRLVPMPQRMMEVVNAQGDWASGKLAMEDFKRIEREGQLECLRLFGFSGSLEWARENWGTKWNAYALPMEWDVDSDVDYEEDARDADGNPARRHYIQLRFQTAWSYPGPIIEKMMALAESLEVAFDHWYSDEGGDDYAYDPEQKRYVMRWNHNVISDIYWEGA